MIVSQAYQTKTQHVGAIQVTKDNLFAVVDWIKQDERANVKARVDDRGFQIEYTDAPADQDLRISGNWGDWIIDYDAELSAVRAGDFDRLYEPRPSGIKIENHPPQLKRVPDDYEARS